MKQIEIVKFEEFTEILAWNRSAEWNIRIPKVEALDFQFVRIFASF